MGAGVALAIRQKYPEAYAADCAVPSTPNKLGSFTYADTADGKTIFNLYGQLGFGHIYRQTNYEAIAVGLEKIRAFVLKNKPNAVIGIPFLMGCALGGGDWRVVESIILSIFGDLRLKVYICVLPERRDQYNTYIEEKQRIYAPLVVVDEFPFTGLTVQE